MKVRNSGYCNSSFEPRAAGWESNSRRPEGDGHDSSARSHFNPARGDPAGRERSRAPVLDLERLPRLDVVRAHPLVGGVVVHDAQAVAEVAQGEMAVLKGAVALQDFLVRHVEEAPPSLGALDASPFTFDVSRSQQSMGRIPRAQLSDRVRH